MKGPENFNPEENAKEVIESLKDTEAGKYMESEPMPTEEELRENSPEDIKKYRIAWKDSETGRTGHGEYALTKKVAEDWLEKMKEERPSMEHWIEEKSQEESQK